MKLTGAHTQNGVLVLAIERRTWLLFKVRELWVRNTQSRGWKDRWLRMPDGKRNADISFVLDDQLDAMASLHAVQERMAMDAPDLENLERQLASFQEEQRETARRVLSMRVPTPFD